MRELAVKGLKWSFVQQIIVQIINYLSVVVLAALVDPEVHGFITIASVPVGFVGVLGSLGVREKVVKEIDVNDEYKSCLLGFVVISSILLFLLNLFLTVLIAWFYQDKFSFEVLMKFGFLLSLITPIGVFIHYFESFQTRVLNFKGLTITNAISMLFGATIAIFVAYHGYGYQGLSLKLVLPHLFNLLLHIVIFKPSLKTSWCPSMYKEFKSFFMFLTFNNIANYFTRNIDYLIIGKVFNAEILGQYAIAYKILLFPMKNVTSRIQSVAMPMLSKLNITSDDFNKKYFMIVGLVSFITLPMMAIVAITAHDWVPYTFNNNYNLLVHMIIVLSVVGAFQSLVSPVGALYLLKESTKIMFINSRIISVVISLAFLLSAMTHNINYVMLTYSITWCVLVMPISMYRIFSIYNMKLGSFFLTIFPSLISVLFASGLVYLVRKNIVIDNMFLSVFFSVVFFLLIYLMVYRIINKKSELSLNFYYQLFIGK